MCAHVKLDPATQPATTTPSKKKEKRLERPKIHEISMVILYHTHCFKDVHSSLTGPTTLEHYFSMPTCASPQR